MRFYILLLSCFLIITIPFEHLDAAEGNASIFWGHTNVVDASAEQWLPGFTIGAYVLHRVSPSTLLGLRFSINNWVEERGGGSLVAIELFPTYRYIVKKYSSSGLNFVGQIGLGYVIVDGGLGGRAQPLPTPDCANCTTIEPDSKWFWDYGNFGLNFGFGILSANSGKIHMEFIPMVHIGFTRDEINSFVSFNLGIVFGDI